MLVCITMCLVNIVGLGGIVVTPTCGPVCTMFCELGMKTDQRGCPICECSEYSLSPT